VIDLTEPSVNAADFTQVPAFWFETERRTVEEKRS